MIKMMITYDAKWGVRFDYFSLPCLLLVCPWKHWPQSFIVCVYVKSSYTKFWSKLPLSSCSLWIRSLLVHRYPISAIHFRGYWKIAAPVAIPLIHWTCLVSCLPVALRLNRLWVRHCHLCSGYLLYYFKDTHVADQYSGSSRLNLQVVFVSAVESLMTYLLRVSEEH